MSGSRILPGTFEFGGEQQDAYVGPALAAQAFERFPRFAPAAARMHAMIGRHPTAAVLGVRFMYGLRTAGPIALGALGVPPWKFVLFNLLGAALWSTAFALLGYQFGNALQWWLKDLRDVEEGVLVVLLLAAMVLPLWWRWRHRRAP